METRSLESRLSRMERKVGTGLTDSQSFPCGKGVPVTRTQAEHGHECWRRESAVEWAGACMILEALRRGEPEPDYHHPPPWLVQQCCEAIVAKGVELVAEDDDDF